MRSYIVGAIRVLAIFGFGLVFATHAAAQLGPPQKFTPKKFCASGDNSLECMSERNHANIERYSADYKEQVRLEAEKRRVEQQERDRLRTVREKDCNPRVRRCD